MTPHLRICLAAFIIDGAVMIALIALPFFVFQQLGGGVAMSGAMGAAHMAGYALTCFLMSGVVARAKNGLHWALLGFSLFTLFICILPFFRNPWICGAIVTAAFCSQALIWPALHSWVGAEADPVSRTRHMGWFNLAWSFGFAVSPLMTGPLVDTDYRLSFLVLFGLGVLGIGLVWSMPHERAHFPAASAEELEARADHDRASEAYLHASWCATFLANVFVAVTRTVYPKRIEELVHSGQLRFLWEASPPEILLSGDATKFSWLASSLAFSTALSFLVLGKTHFWRHNSAVLFGLQLAAAGAFWVLGHTHSLIAMMGCFSVIGVLVGVAFFSSVYYSLADPAHKHRRATINEGAVGLGGFLGSIVFGNLVAHFGLGLPFHATPVFILVALAVQWALLRHGHVRVQRAYAARAKN